MSAGANGQGRAQQFGQWLGCGPWQGLCAVVTSPPSLLASPPDQDLVSEPSDEAQAAAAGAEDGAFLQPISPLRTSEWCCVLAAHVHGPAPASGPARGCLWGLHLGGTASTHSGPQQRLQSTACGLLGRTLLCRVQRSQSFLAGCLTLYMDYD